MTTDAQWEAEVKAACQLAPDWHPLSHIDNFILACGWTHSADGFVPPPDWQPAIRVHHGGGLYWRREHAVQFCIRYHERLSRLALAPQ